MYRGEPGIADRMRVLAFRDSLLQKASLQKQEPQAEGPAAPPMAPPPVSPPSSPMSEPPAGGGPPPPEMIEALSQNGKVYENTKEALSDFEMGLTEIATDITAHIGTIGQTKYTDDLDGDSVMGHAASMMALRDRVEDTRNMCEIIRLKDAGMVNHIPGMGGGMPGMGDLQNMPAPGPGGMPGMDAGPMAPPGPPGAMPMPPGGGM